MTLHINLLPELEGFVQSQITSGDYASPEEVIGVALASMKTQKEKKIALLRAIEEGENSGEGRLFTDELMDSIFERAVRNAHTGRPIDPDVLP